MQTEIPLLNNVKVAAPCQQKWNDMVGGDRVRYCRSCEKNVYNLSEMSQTEAENLLQTHEGHLCVRFYQRADGKIMTNNCPVGLRAIRKMYVKQTAAIASLCGLFFGALMQFAGKSAPANETTEEHYTMGAPLPVSTPRLPMPRKQPTQPHYTMGAPAPLHTSKKDRQEEEAKRAVAKFKSESIPQNLANEDNTDSP